MDLLDTQMTLSSGATAPRATAPIDVLIQTFNEEQNLPHTLASLSGWVRRVFIVDSGSTDRTMEIAAEHGAEVIEHSWEGYASQKNWALDNLPFESPWILILDADEAVSPELRDEMIAFTSRPPDEVPESGVYINRIFVFMGRPIRHCGYFPSWNLRLFKRGRARYEKRLVHEHMIVDGPIGYLQHLMIHEDRRGLEHFFAKHNRYSSLEAREIIEAPEPWPGLRRFFNDRVARRRFGKSRIMCHLPAPWVWRLLYMYILRAGFLDGRAGWSLSNFISAYEFSIQMKVRELRQQRRTYSAHSGLSEPEGSHRYLETDVEERIDKTAEPQQLAISSPSDNGQTIGTPTLKEAAGAPRFFSPWSLRQNIGRVMWMLVNSLLFRPSFHNWYAWRRMLLRSFGAKIGRQVRIRPTAYIEIPWNIEIGDSTVIGDYAIIYSLGKITIGKLAVISQYAHLCAGTHDHTQRSFPLITPPITLGDEVWIAADAFVGPGVTIHTRAVLGARASAFTDIPPNVIAVGNPAKAIKERPLST